MSGSGCDGSITDTVTLASAVPPFPSDMVYSNAVKRRERERKRQEFDKIHRTKLYAAHFQVLLSSPEKPGFGE